MQQKRISRNAACQYDVSICVRPIHSIRHHQTPRGIVRFINSSYKLSTKTTCSILSPSKCQSYGACRQTVVVGCAYQLRVDFKPQLVTNCKIDNTAGYSFFKQTATPSCKLATSIIYPLPLYANASVPT